ncbi:MAG: putative metalloprotease CJM1_0395 family protein [Fidelibacterota bacterium]
MMNSHSLEILKSQPANRIDTSQFTPAINQAGEFPNKSEKDTSTKGHDQKSHLDTFELSDEEKKIIQELKARDREVRIHEQQHQAAAGQYARGMSFEYQVGPDNKRYAVGGQVNLDTSEIPGEPEKTIEKMKQIKRAALAPAQPSAKDRQVAAESDREIMEQQAEIAKQKREKAIEAYTDFDRMNANPTINITQT